MGAQGRGGPVRFRVVESEEGTMLGHLIARRLGELSVAEGRALVKAGAVYMGHLRVRVPTVRVVAGERITVYPEALEHKSLASAAVRFVHRDATFVVLDKPAGVPVAQTKQSSRGTLSEALRRVLSQEGMARPYVGLVHRLDMAASGLVLFTIRDVANKSVYRQFVDHSMQRQYLVLVQGAIDEPVSCDAPLVEGSDGRVRIGEPGEPRARPAQTTFVPVRRVGSDTLVEASLTTGRTHQIRVHAAHLGHPVVGDIKYGAAQGETTLHLHAHRLAFAHPLTGEPVVVTSTPPEWAATRRGG